MQLRSYFAILFTVLSAFAFAEPINDDVAAKLNSYEEEEAPQNLWTWPEEVASLNYKGQQAVWTPDASKWYSKMSNRGYVSSDPSNLNGNWFEEDSLHVCFQGWYLMGRYIYLEPGKYVISYDYVCETYANNTGNEFQAYYASGNGFVWGYRISLNEIRIDRGDYKSISVTFSIPDNIPLVGFWIGPTSSDSARNEATIWNVFLTKVED